MAMHGLRGPFIVIERGHSPGHLQVTLYTRAKKPIEVYEIEWRKDAFDAIALLELLDAFGR